MDKIKTRHEEELHGCLVFFEILGLQYFSLQLLSDKNFQKNPSYLRCIYFILILLMLTALMVVYSLSESDEMMKTDIKAKNILNYVIQNSMKIGMILVLISSLFQSFVTTKKVKNIYINIKKLIDIMSVDFKVRIDFSIIRQNMRRNTAAVCVFFIITHGAMMFMMSDSTTQLLYIIAGTPPLIFIYATVYKYFFYVQMINRQLKILINLIEGFFQTNPIKFVDEIDVKYIQVKMAKCADNVLKKFIGIKKTFNLIYENANLINESMGFTVLTLLIVIVISLTASGYQIFITLIEQKSKDQMPEIIYVLVMGLSFLISIVYCCQNTQNIMKQLATAVNKIECENYEQLNDETREFIHKFYLQLNHQPILFSAFGFYTINLALLASILTGIVSYQIILVQFYAA